MLAENIEQMNFFSEISNHQISANEFFSATLLDYLDKNFGWKKVLISYFNKYGGFLSWTSWQGVLTDSPIHPYRNFITNDVIRNVVYQEAVKDRLTYFNTQPRLYKSTDVISKVDYEYSAYVRFIENNFQMHFSVTMAFGINAYIQVTFFKSLEQGDFTNKEMKRLNEIYIYLANAYKNFKKYEQAKIVQKIQSKIIESEEKNYLVTDEFMHVMSYSETALEYLRDIFGSVIPKKISNTVPCSWLSLLLDEDNNTIEDYVQTRIIKNYIFKIYIYDQTYSNGIKDRYHWITITKKDELPFKNDSEVKKILTPTEQKVAEMLYNGLTYKEIAGQMIVSYHTIKKHVQNIYIKCGVNSRFELYRWIDNRKK